jgi:hypothetical protein
MTHERQLLFDCNCNLASVTEGPQNIVGNHGTDPVSFVTVIPKFGAAW